MNTINQNKKPGRPMAIIAWPNAPFTIAALKASTKFSKPTIYNCVTKALGEGVLVKAGKESLKFGRPRALFKLKTVVPSVLPSVDSVMQQATNN